MVGVRYCLTVSLFTQSVVVLDVQFPIGRWSLDEASLAGLMDMTLKLVVQATELSLDKHGVLRLKGCEPVGTD